MSKDNRSRATAKYVNTVIFAIICLAILAGVFVFLVYNKKFESLSPFFTTLAVGLVLLLLFLVIEAIRYEMKYNDMIKNSYNNMLSIDSCPDYWTRNGDLCTNSYTSPNDPNTTVVIKNNPRTINLNSYNNKKVIDACTAMRKNVQAPWTDLRMVCDAYST